MEEGRGGGDVEEEGERLGDERVADGALEGTEIAGEGGSGGGEAGECAADEASADGECGAKEENSGPTQESPGAACTDGGCGSGTEEEKGEGVEREEGEERGGGEEIAAEAGSGEKERENVEEREGEERGREVSENLERGVEREREEEGERQQEGEKEQEGVPEKEQQGEGEGENGEEQERVEDDRQDVSGSGKPPVETSRLTDAASCSPSAPSLPETAADASPTPAVASAPVAIAAGSAAAIPAASADTEGIRGIADGYGAVGGGRECTPLVAEASEEQQSHTLPANTLHTQSQTETCEQAAGCLVPTAPESPSLLPASPAAAAASPLPTTASLSSATPPSATPPHPSSSPLPAFPYSLAPATLPSENSSPQPTPAPSEASPQPVLSPAASTAPGTPAAPALPESSSSAATADSPHGVPDAEKGILGKGYGPPLTLPMPIPLPMPMPLPVPLPVPPGVSAMQCAPGGWAGVAADAAWHAMPAGMPAHGGGPMAVPGGVPMPMPPVHGEMYMPMHAACAAGVGAGMGAGMGTGMEMGIGIGREPCMGMGMGTDIGSGMGMEAGSSGWGRDVRAWQGQGAMEATGYVAEKEWGMSGEAGRAESVGMGKGGEEEGDGWVGSTMVGAEGGTGCGVVGKGGRGGGGGGGGGVGAEGGGNSGKRGGRGSGGAGSATCAAPVHVYSFEQLKQIGLQSVQYQRDTWRTMNGSTQLAVEELMRDVRLVLVVLAGKLVRFDTSQLKTDFSIPHPRDDLEYLRRVRWERERLLRRLQSQLFPRLLSNPFPSSLVRPVQVGAGACECCMCLPVPALLLPSHEWRQHMQAAFGYLLRQWRQYVQAAFGYLRQVGAFLLRQLDVSLPPEVGAAVHGMVPGGWVLLCMAWCQSLEGVDESRVATCHGMPIPSHRDLHAWHSYCFGRALPCEKGEGGEGAVRGGGVKLKAKRRSGRKAGGKGEGEDCREVNQGEGSERGESEGGESDEEGSREGEGDVDGDDEEKDLIGEEEGGAWEEDVDGERGGDEGVEEVGGGGREEEVGGERGEDEAKGEKGEEEKEDGGEGKTKEGGEVCCGSEAEGGGMEDGGKREIECVEKDLGGEERGEGGEACEAGAYGKVEGGSLREEAEGDASASVHDMVKQQQGEGRGEGEAPRGLALLLPCVTAQAQSKAPSEGISRGLTEGLLEKLSDQLPEGLSVKGLSVTDPQGVAERVVAQGETAGDGVAGDDVAGDGVAGDGVAGDVMERGDGDADVAAMECVLPGRANQLAPLLGTVLHCDAVGRAALLRAHVDWAIGQSAVDTWRGMWLVAWAAGVDEPIEAETAASLRELLRKCAGLRASIQSREDEGLEMLNVLIEIAGAYFKQGSKEEMEQAVWEEQEGIDGEGMARWGGEEEGSGVVGTGGEGVEAEQESMEMIDGGEQRVADPAGAVEVGTEVEAVV
ncbi:unnamed protein product [Closterium sp. NIES-65]|nr:unnamed protein product [Closterium sp. NIES-65]